MTSVGVGQTGKGGVRECLAVSKTGWFTVGVNVVFSSYFPSRNVYFI